ncbi:hypothetical protein AB0J35_21630 [Nonomuraea angiospora]|uniref:hypothetical protein n=1 Tax=Nonomuraea angiospora TaxID=46172 RepID=UPI0034492465
MRKNAAPIVLAALLTTGLITPAVASASAAVVEVRLTTTSTMRESDSLFVCPSNQVMIGREHHGDENGYTTYRCGRIFINGEQVTVLSLYPYSAGAPKYEPDSFFTTDEDKAIVGRKHIGDETAFTTYYAGTMFWKGQVVKVGSRRWTDLMYENDHSSRAEAAEIMTGRWHGGDENGMTTYEYGTVTVDGGQPT